MAGKDSLSTLTYLNIGFWNVDGLTSKLDQQMFLDSISYFDILILAETWLSEKIDIPGFDTNIFQPGTKKSSKYGKGRKSGGLSLHVKPHLSKGIKCAEKHRCFIWFQLDKTFFKAANDIFVCGAYLPPDKSAYGDIEHWEILQNKVAKYYDKGDILILGDLNARTGNEQDFVSNDRDDRLDVHEDSYVHDVVTCKRTSLDLKCNKYGRELTQLCKSCKLRILNGRSLGDIPGQYTYMKDNGKSVIDYGISCENLVSLVSYFFVHPPTVHSPHSLIEMNLKLSTSEREYNKKENVIPIVQYKWDTESAELFKKALALPTIKKQIEHVLSTSYNKDSIGIETCIRNVHDIVINAAKICLRKKKKSKKKSKKKWADYSVEILKQRLLSLAKLVQRYPHEPYIYGQFATFKKRYKTITRRQRLKFKEDISAQIQNLEDKNPKAFWELVNKLRDRKKNGNNLHPDTWLEYFKDLHKKKVNMKYDMDFQEKVENKLKNLSNLKIYNEELDKDITAKDIEENIQHLKNGKSSGPDSITNEMIKAGNTVLIPVLIKLFNMLLHNSVFPHSWAEGYITPIFKGGDASDPSNYRGITVSSCLGKVFTNILNQRMSSFLEKNEIISPSQIGFQKGHRTTDHIFVLRSIIDIAKHKSKTLYACFVDIRKAFDSIWIDGLIYRLYNYNFSSKLVSLIKDMYSKIRARVKIDQKVTSSFPVNIGTRQGCNLSPTLFNIFINELPGKLEKKVSNPVELDGLAIHALMYADDIVLLNYSKVGLQQSLIVLEHFCKKWKLSINFDKTKVMIFNKKPICGVHTFMLCGRPIDEVSQYCYLGVVFTPSGSFKAAKKRLFDKACKAYWAWNKTLNTFNGTSAKVLLKLFDSTCKPILLYGCEVWGGYDCKLMNNTDPLEKILYDTNKTSLHEKLHNKVCKQTLGLSKKSSCLMSKAELGRYPLNINVIISMLKFWLHAKDSPYGTLINAAYRANIKLSQTTQNSYLNRLKHILARVGYTHILEKSLKEVNSDISHIIIKLSKLYEQQFFQLLKTSKAKDSDKYEIYKHFKKNYNMENYIWKIENNKERIAIAKFRTSSGSLPISIMRYRSPHIGIQERKCVVCTSDCTGDERHYLFDCNNTKLSIMRKTLFKNIAKVFNQLDHLTDKDKLIYLMLCNDHKLTIIFAKFLVKLLQFVSDKNNHI
jgi:hypothetical protein